MAGTLLAIDGPIEDALPLVEVVAGDVSFGAPLTQAVHISLFSDAEADPTDPGADGERRGWWAGDLDELDAVGSRLWLLERAKLTQSNVALAGQYAREALAWMVEDGVAASVAATAQRSAEGTVDLTVEIVEPSGNRVGYRFRSLWEAHRG